MCYGSNVVLHSANDCRTTKTSKGMSPSTLIGASRSCRTRERKKIIKNCFNHGNITDTTQTQPKTLSCAVHTCGIKFSPLLSLVFSNHVNGSIDGGTHFGYKWQKCLHNRTCTTLCMSKLVMRCLFSDAVYSRHFYSLSSLTL